MKAASGADLYAFDAAWVAGREESLAGADEAGRGAMAGPFYAASVILDGAFVEGVRDSKLLSVETRERLFAEIVTRAEAVCVVSYPAWWVDRYGVGRANREALSKVLEISGAGVKIADGNLRLGEDITSIPRADSSSASVAAASVVAKVLRDHAMVQLAREHPEYGFERNRGYGTSEHRLALYEVGPCRVHRFSYSGVESSDRSD